MSCTLDKTNVIKALGGRHFVGRVEQVSFLSGEKPHVIRIMSHRQDYNW